MGLRSQGAVGKQLFFASGPKSQDAGLRLSFQGYNDSLPKFAPDVARLIAQHTGPSNSDELEIVRRAALTEIRRGAAASLQGSSGVGASLEKLTLSEIRDESESLWASISSEAGASSQALVAGAVDAVEAGNLLQAIVAALRVLSSESAIATTSARSADPGERPSAVLTRRPIWQGPVAQSLCLASGVPSLLDVCGRTFSR